MCNAKSNNVLYLTAALAIVADLARAADADWEDVDEHEKDVFDKDGYFDVQEDEAAISKAD